MDDNKENLMDSIIGMMPPRASSTVMKKKKARGAELNDTENSLGVLNLSNASGISGFRALNDNDDDVGKILEQQRLLAEQSLRRISQIPSKFLVNKEVSETDSSILSGSTVSESDLLATPANGGSSRSSIVSIPTKDFDNTSFGRTLSDLSQKAGNPQFSLNDLMRQLNMSINPELNNQSELFRHSVDIKTQLQADEMSWRKKHDLPVQDDSFASVCDPAKMSMGEFFKQKSNSFSELKACASPKRGKPVPLLTESELGAHSELLDSLLKPKEGVGETFTQPRAAEASKESLAKGRPDSMRTPSITQIQEFLANSQTPNKIMNLLGAHNLSGESEINVPGSRDSSYTSNYSENEAIVNIVQNSEKDVDSVKVDKVNTLNVNATEEDVSPKIGRRTSSCLSSLTDGKLPIETTKFELIWGCVKVDKSETKDFLIRNKSSKTLRIQIHVTGPNFKIRKDPLSEADALSAAKLLLHGNESRQIFVSFTPTKNGAAFEELRFTPLDFPEQQSKKQSIKLCGYGGFYNFEILNIPKDLSGKFLINLGTIDKNNIVQSFMVRNTGNLSAFCQLQYTRKHISLFCNVVIAPSFFTLQAGEAKEVTVSYEPSVNDHKFLQVLKGLVHELGGIKVVYGAEVNRARLRRLVNKSLEQQIRVDPQCHLLSEKLKDEVIPADVVKIRDGVHSLGDISQTFCNKEIIVTLEQDPEQTIMPQLHDETELFTTLCNENTMVENSVIKDACKLEPQVVILSPPVKTEDAIFLISENTKVLHFEAQSNPPGLEITPKEGRLAPGQTLILHVKYTKCLSQKQSYKVVVYVDHSVLEAEVKVYYISRK